MPIIKDDSREYLLRENPNRFVLFPIVETKIWKFYKQAQASNWVSEEVDLEEDKKDWDNKLNADEKYFISRVLAFFAGADGIVNENLCSRFSNEVTVPEARAFYTMQAQIETVHSEVYSSMLDTFVKDEAEKKFLFDAIRTIPCIKKKADWMMDHIDSSGCFAERLVGFILAEGLFFSGSFAAIYWLNKRGLMKGLSFANALIARDEGLHCMFGILLYSMLENKLTEAEIYSIFDEAVECEIEFVTQSLPVSLIGMNKDLMAQYIRYVADKLLYDLGYKKRYNGVNPFEWLELISLQSKTNFFERRVDAYQKSGVMERLDKGRDESANILVLDADF